MKITEITRRDIIDEMKRRHIAWYGRMEDIEFLSRLYDLEELPSYDSRYKDMLGDIRQHRVNNYDWEDDWVLNDERLNLSDDNKFLSFLCGTLHPLVRGNKEEVKALLDLYNAYLESDGWKLVATSFISGRPVYSAVEIGTIIEVENKDKISHTYVQEQLAKCETKIDRGDFDGAITNARSLMEGVFEDIYQRVLGEKIPKFGKLLEGYKEIRRLVNFTEDKSSNDAVKAIVRSLVGIVDGIDELANMMGDRHRRPVKPSRHHARLVVNAAKTVIDFLYSSMEYQFEGRENLYEEYKALLNSRLRGESKEKLLQTTAVKDLFERYDGLYNNPVKRKFIQEFSIASFRQSDIFFSAMSLFRDDLEKKDIAQIFTANEKNSQAIGLRRFLVEMYRTKPQLLENHQLKGQIDNFILTNNEVLFEKDLEYFTKNFLKADNA